MTHPAPAWPYECTVLNTSSTTSASTLGPSFLAGLRPHWTLNTSNDPSFVNNSGARHLQPSRIALVVSLLTSVSLGRSQICTTGFDLSDAHQLPTSLVPPKMVVPLPGRGITYLFSFIVFADFDSPFTSTVCPLTGNIA